MTGLRADIINNCLKQNGGKNMTKSHVHVTHFKFNNKGRFKANWWKKIYHTNIKEIHAEKQTSEQIKLLETKAINIH